jgi:predicted nucleic acid-binding protein
MKSTIDIPESLYTMAKSRAVERGQTLKQITHKPRWLPLSPQVLAGMIGRFSRIPRTTFLRAADTLHIACAAEQGFTEVYSNDRHFLAAAPLFGLNARTVIV